MPASPALTEIVARNGSSDAFIESLQNLVTAGLATAGPEESEEIRANQCRRCRTKVGHWLSNEKEEDVGSLRSTAAAGVHAPPSEVQGSHTKGYGHSWLFSFWLRSKVGVSCLLPRAPLR